MPDLFEISPPREDGVLQITLYPRSVPDATPPGESRDMLEAFLNQLEIDASEIVGDPDRATSASFMFADRFRSASVGRRR